MFLLLSIFCLFLYIGYIENQQRFLRLRLLYHYPMSSSSKSIRLLLGEYDIPYKALVENPWDSCQKLVDLDSCGVFPILVESDDFAIIGAMPVAEHINETFTSISESLRVFPVSAIDRAEMRRLCDFSLIRFDSEVCSILAHERVHKRMLTVSQGGGSPDSDLLRLARSRLQGYLDYFGSMLEHRDYLVCSRLTFADLCVASCLCVLDYLGEIEWVEGSGLKNWYSRIKSRPSFRPLLSDRVQGVACVSHYVDLDF